MLESWLAHDGAPLDNLAELAKAGRKEFPEAFSPGLTPLPEAPVFQHLFAGLLMLADWIGSNSVNRPGFTGE